MKYKFSNTEYTYTDENGKIDTYKVCDACGTEQRSNFGFRVDYARAGACGTFGLGLCGRCAGRLVPMIEEALGRMKGASGDE